MLLCAHDLFYLLTLIKLFGHFINYIITGRINVTGHIVLYSSSPPPVLQNAVIAALSSKSWDVETATELLLSNWDPARCEDPKQTPVFTASAPPRHIPPLPFFFWIEQTTPYLPQQYSEPTFTATLLTYKLDTGSNTIANMLTTLLPVWSHVFRYIFNSHVVFHAL